MKYLESERGLKLEEVEAGIYYVIGDIISIQILEQRKLSSKDNLFLKALRSDVDLSDISSIIERWEQEALSRKNKFWEIVTLANKSKFKEATGMSAELKKFLEEVFEEHGWDDERIVRERIEFAKKLIKRNRPIDEIVEDTGLTNEEVERLTQ